MATYGNGVHYYYSTMSGASVLSGNGGSLINVIKSCLIDGFGSEVAQGSWVVAFEATHKIALRSTDTNGTQFFLRIDDSDVRYAVVVGYETMSDIDTGSGAFNEDRYWRKALSDGYSPYPWNLIADSRAFYLFSYWNQSNPSNGEGYFFGDIVSRMDGVDNYNCALIAARNTTYTGVGGSSGLDSSFWAVNVDSPNNNHWLARGYTQTGSPVTFSKYSHDLNGTVMGGVGSGVVYPDKVNNEFLVHPIDIFESHTKAFRGKMPGLFAPMAFRTPPGGTVVTVEGIGSVLCIRLAYSNNDHGRAAINLTGPWRDDGHLSISGVVTELMVPGAYRVNLFRQSDMQLVKTTWSDGSGAYAFTGLNSQKYVVMAIDHTSPLRSPAIQDNVVPS